MATIKAAILGFGTVGQGIYHVLNEKREELEKKLGVEIEVAKILVRDTTVERVPGTKQLLTNNIEEVLAVDGLQVVFEAIVNEEPAYSYLKAAIGNKCHIVTANKVMFAKYGAELQELANEKGVSVGFEATVAGGVPVIKTMKNILLVNKVSKVQGILNGTTNYMLTKMRTENWSYDEALAEAQRLGYAETDPFNDVSGQDAFKKLMVLSDLAFGEQPEWSEVQVIGIDSLTEEALAEAKTKDLRYRHVAEVEQYEDGRIVGRVMPVLVDGNHPLYPIDDVNNAVTMETDYIGTLTLIGPGAGMYPTASVMVEDFVEMVGKRAKDVVSI